MPWDTLPESIRELWKIDPALVVQVKVHNAKKVEAYTSIYRYLWTFMPSRQQWTVKKTEL